MDKVDRTLKLRAFNGDVPADTPKDNLTKEQSLALEVRGMTEQLEEERKHSIELHKIIEQMKERIALEQSKVQELARQASRMAEEIHALHESFGKISQATGNKK
jgi:hypothetical protein